jgi:diacylglycerol kinase (ATP)
MPHSTMNKPRRTGLARIFWATHYSYRGIKAAWLNEAAFRQELGLMLIMMPAAFWLGTTTEQRLLLILPCIIVVIVELLNSAIEAAIDRISPEMHELSGQSKDMASAAVFFALWLVIISWGMIAWDRFAGS